MTSGRRRCVLVTGASSGIGRATAEVFARQGDRVLGTSRSVTGEDDADPGITMVRLDVRDPDSVEQCIQTVVDRAGPIDVLINNAGVMQRGIAEETTEAQATDMMQTNLLGPARMINAVLPMMRVQGSGRIINVGSLASWIGEPGEAYYAASKAALARYSEALRHEVQHCGIHVSLVEPGVFGTAVLENAVRGATPIADYDVVRSAVTRTLEKAMAAGADPAQVARLILAVSTAHRPARRYGVGHGARWIPLVQVLVPQRCTDALLRRGYGLDS